jgi:cyclic pyranopterin phosphate synthase
MPPEGVRFRPHEKTIGYERIVEIVRAAAGLGFDKIRLTGGEPLVRKGIVDLVRMLSQVNGITTLAMTTNGTLLSPLASDLAIAGLSSVNISLDSVDPARYAEITRGGSLELALSGIRSAIEVGLRVKLNVVVDPARPEDEAGVRGYALKLGVPVQTISRYSLSERKSDGYETDRPPPCAVCDRIRLLSDGTLRPCLHSSLGIDASSGDPREALLRVIALKPAHGGIAEEKSVSEIGG